MSNVAGQDSARKRDERFEELVKQYQTSVLRMCYLYLRDQTMAEDAAQETFLKAYRSMDGFRGECSEKTWIMKLAVHACYDMNHANWFRFVNRRLTPDMLPERAAPAEERDGELAAAVLRLPVKLREVILLKYYQGLKVNEIADVLGIAQSSVSGRLSRGRTKLKGMLKGRELDE